MNEWMDGCTCTNGWIEVLMDEWIGGQVDVLLDGQMDGWIDGYTNGWMSGQMDVHVLMDGWKY